MTLLACVEDPIAMRDELSVAERGWLRDAAPRLRLAELDLYDLFSAVELRRARAAYALLTAPA